MISYLARSAHFRHQAYLPNSSSGLQFRTVGGQGHLLFAQWMGKAKPLPRANESARIPCRIAILSDGTPTTVRELRQSDRSAMIKFLQGLSPLACAYRGWRAPKSETGCAKIADLLIKNLKSPSDGELVMATGKDLIGLASFHQMKGKDMRGKDCELLLVIADSWQKKKAGKQLLEITMDAARSAGFNKAVAYIWRCNNGMLGLAKQLDFVYVSTTITEEKRMEKLL